MANFQLTLDIQKTSDLPFVQINNPATKRLIDIGSMNSRRVGEKYLSDKTCLGELHNLKRC